MILREYQQAAVDGVQGVYRSGRRRALLVAPTGAGKSALMRYMLGRTSKRTLILCHREELRDMICDSMEVPYGVIAGGRAVPHERVHIGMMQTVSRRLDTLPPYEWVISDEAHLAMCETWRKILRHYDQAWHLGMSATPCRLDGKGLGAEYEQIVYGPSIRELTARGFLTPCRVFAPSTVGGSARKASKVDLAAAAAEIDRSSITGDVIAHYQKSAPGRQAIVFCCSREHADHVARQFVMAGIPAVNVDGAMSAAERRNRIDAFRARRIEVLTNVDLLTTGWDCPQVEVGIMLRPTQSLALYLQMIGRILRIHPGKRDAILLDHVGNVIAHGMPDEDREWTLDGRLVRTRPPPVRQCPKCYASFAPAPRCPSCGYAFPVQQLPGRKLVQRGGDLAEVDESEVRRLREGPLRQLLTEARTVDQLQAIARARGYDGRWVIHVMKARRARQGWAAA